MSDSEATTSTDRAGTDSSATVHNPEESRLKALLEPAVLANRLYLEDVSIHVAGSHRTVHVVVDLPQEETGGVSLTRSPMCPVGCPISLTTIPTTTAVPMTSKCPRPASDAR